MGTATFFMYFNLSVDVWPHNFNFFSMNSVCFTISFSSLGKSTFTCNICHLLTSWEQRLMSLQFPPMCQAASLLVSVSYPHLFYLFSFLWEWSVPYLTAGSGVNPLPTTNTPTARAPLSQRCSARTAPQRKPWHQQVWNSVCLQARWVWSILPWLVYTYCWWQIRRKL